MGKNTHILHPGRATGLIIGLLFGLRLSAQQAVLPLPHPAHEIAERLITLSGIEPAIHTDIKPFSRIDLAQLAQKLDSLAAGPEVRYLLDDNAEWTDTPRVSRRPLFKYFYRRPAAFFHVNKKDFYLQADPLLQFSLGRDRGGDRTIFRNQRGLAVRGSVDRVYFYTSVLESQVANPAYMEAWTDTYEAVPGAGFYKPFNSRLFGVPDARDFNLANAWVGFQATRHIGLQMGHSRFFIGNGHRSLLLSDFGPYYFYFQISTRVWRLHYQNLFVELSPVSQQQVPDGVLLPKKYAAIHYLSYRAGERFSIGFFEGAVFNRSRQFEWQYLNPLILYRSVEGLIGSPDNILVGLNAQYRAGRRLRFYGQFMLDEFRVNDLFFPEERGWWGNKYGIQAGAQYYDAFGITALDMQVEFNTVRPYTYAHQDSLNAYTHYNQALAHPLGANFREAIFLINWQPAESLCFKARWIHAVLGENTSAQNWGANPLLSYSSRVQEYGNTTAQGVRTDLDLFGLDVTWSPFPNYFLDLQFLHRKKGRESTQLISLGVRVNHWVRDPDF